MNTLTLNEIENVFGKFSYVDQNNGLVTVDQGWLDKNLTFIVTPAGITKCHVKLVKVFINLFKDIKKEKLEDFVTFMKCGGGWSPRKKCWDKNRELSTHAWGIACDLNVKDNPYGRISFNTLSFSETNVNTSKIIRIFESYGFIWGGKLTPLNPTHFEFVDINKIL